METKEISPHKYAKWKGCHISYIHRLLLEGRIDELPNIIRVKKYSRFYVLEVPAWLSKDSFKEIKSKKSPM